MHTQVRKEAKRAASIFLHHSLSVSLRQFLLEPRAQVLAGLDAGKAQLPRSVLGLQMCVWNAHDSGASTLHQGALSPVLTIYPFLTN